MNIAVAKEDVKGKYAQQIRDITEQRDLEYYIWAEELALHKIRVYKGELKKCMPGYKKKDVHRCGIFYLNLNSEIYPLQCVSGDLQLSTEIIYIQKECFLGKWNKIQFDINKGIREAKLRGLCESVERPEDILDFSLITGDLKPVKGNIKEIISDKPKRKRKDNLIDGRKQSLLDKREMVYFYGENDECAHDKSCEQVKRIPPALFCASSELPEGMKMCPNCERKLLFRKACYPNVKETAVCNAFFCRNHVELKILRKLILDSGAGIHAISKDELIVTVHEDTWKIKEVNGKMELWHNNYEKLNETERYITEGFHKQKMKQKNLRYVLGYIDNYTWEKHLQGHGIKTGQVEEISVVESSAAVEEKYVETKKVSIWMRVWRWVKKSLR